MKNSPIVISSLEEDFKKIGLIKSTPLAESMEEAAPIAERSIFRGGKKVKVKKMTSAQRMVAKKRRKTGAYKAWAKKYAKKLKKFAKKIAKRAAKAVKAGTRKESVEIDMAEALKSHANLAIIAENLGNYFGAIEQVCENEEMGESAIYGFMAEYFGEIAESMASVATSLHEGSEEFDGESLSESFAGTMAVVLDGVDLYEEMELAEKASAEASDDEGMEDEEEEDEEDMDEGNC